MIPRHQQLFIRSVTLPYIIIHHDGEKYTQNEKSCQEKNTHFTNTLKMAIKSKEFGDRLRKKIEEHYPSQRQFAFEMRIKTNTLTGYLNGRVPDVLLLQKFANTLHTTINYLVKGEEEKKLDKESKFIVKEGEKSYLTPEEKEYTDKLIQIFRNKDEETQKAIMQNIDTFLRVPGKTLKKTKLAG